MRSHHLGLVPAPGERRDGRSPDLSIIANQPPSQCGKRVSTLSRASG